MGLILALNISSTGAQSGALVCSNYKVGQVRPAVQARETLAEAADTSAVAGAASTATAAATDVADPLREAGAVPWGTTAAAAPPSDARTMVRDRALKRPQRRMDG